MNQLSMFDASLGVVILPDEEFVWIGGLRLAMTASLRVSMELQKSVSWWLRGCGWSLHENFDYDGVGYRCVGSEGQRTRVWRRLVDAVSEAEGMEWRRAERVPASIAASVNGDAAWRERLEEERPLGLDGSWPLDAVTLEDWVWYRAKSQVLDIRRAVGAWMGAPMGAPMGERWARGWERDGPRDECVDGRVDGREMGREMSA